MEKQEVKCPHCGHEFFTGSKLILCGCGSCGNRFKREENVLNPEIQEKLK